MSIVGIADSNKAAYSDMANAVRTQCNSAAMLALNDGNPLPLEYSAVNYQIPPGSDKAFSRMLVQGAATKKRTLATPSRVTKQGTIVITLLLPRPFNNAAIVGRSMCDVLELALQGRKGSVLFINCFIKDGAPNDRFYSWLIQSTYNYDVLEGPTL